MLDPSLALELRTRPQGRAVMTQSWIDLTFLHFPVDPEEVQRTLPPGLTVDTFPDETGVERAWIGLVPFHISQLKFNPGPKFSFLETNVRTYVHREGKNPGVWFYSLDAADPLACLAARIWFGLPYWHAQMTLAEDAGQVHYKSQRKGGTTPRSEVKVDLGPALKLPSPGELEFFLVERYLLYSYKKGRLRTGQVHHTPYPIQSVGLAGLDDQLVEAAGFQSRPIVSALYSPGVEVEVFSPSSL